MVESKEENSKILPRVKELTLNEENILEENIVWIFGGRRSGTTWLGKQILSHNTYYIHEPTLSDHLAVQLSPGSNNFVRRIDERKTVKDYFFSELYKKTWLFYLRKLIIYRFYASVNDLTRNIIVKEPTTLMDCSDIIASCLPNSKIIILIRDGRDIIDSLIDARREGGWLAKTKEAVIKKEDRMGFIKRRSEIWVKQTENMIKTKEIGNKRNRILIKYEELRKNTFGEAKKIYQFLNNEISDSSLKEIISQYSFENIPENEKGQGKFIRSATPGKWRENFSSKEKNVMNEIMGNTLNLLGYD